MKSAIVTGASSGIGLSISKVLVEMGYRVYGIARDFKKTPFVHDDFKKTICNVTDVKALTTVSGRIMENEKELQVLVNNAGIGYFAPHEEIPVKMIEQIVQTNLLAPMILTRLVLRQLKSNRGFVINIGSVTALKSSSFACAYAATKAGLKHFGDSLWDEARKSGLGVVTINPDITLTNFYDELVIEPSTDPESFIEPSTVAEMVRLVLQQPRGTAVTELTIRPQKHTVDKRKRQA